MSHIINPHYTESESMTGSESGSEEEEEDVPPTAVPLDEAAKLQDMAMSAAAAVEEGKVKQSKSERKARKAMQKLGLKQYPGIRLLSVCISTERVHFVVTILQESKESQSRRLRTFSLSFLNLMYTKTLLQTRTLSSEKPRYAGMT